MSSRPLDCGLDYYHFPTPAFEHQISGHVDHIVSLARVHHLAPDPTSPSGTRWERFWVMALGEDGSGPDEQSAEFPLDVLVDALTEARDIDVLSATLLASDFAARMAELDSLLIPIFTAWHAHIPTGAERVQVEAILDRWHE